MEAISDSKNASSGSAKWVDLKTLCAHLPLSKKTIRNLTRRPVNPLPSYRIEGKVLFDLEEVDRFVRSHRRSLVDVDGVAEEIIRRAKNR